MATPPFKIGRGSNRTMPIVVKTNGVPRNITGMVLEVVVKQAADDQEEELIHKHSNVSGEGLPIDASVGEVDIYFVPADTEDLDADTYKFDIWVIDGAVRHQVYGPADFVVGLRCNDGT